VVQDGGAVGGIDDLLWFCRRRWGFFPSRITEWTMPMIIKIKIIVVATIAKPNEASSGNVKLRQ
jgi:hypothetical protein